VALRLAPQRAAARLRLKFFARRLSAKSGWQEGERYSILDEQVDRLVKNTW